MDGRAGDNTVVESQGVNYLALTFALFGGATVWLLRLVLNSWLVGMACTMGSSWPIWAVTGVATAIGAWSAWIAWGLTRTTARRSDGELTTAHWFGLIGLLFNAASVAGIILETLPVIWIDVCSSTYPL